jgi:CheY-like chemotaxis protein
MMMNEEVVILLAEDDPGHAALIEKSLRRAGVTNDMIRLADGQETLEFLVRRGEGRKRKHEAPYVLLLDIRMPKVDGVEVLRQLKQDGELRKLPVIMLTTTDDPREVQRCHELGCSVYITKPVDADLFIEAVRQLGLLLRIVRVPRIDGVR